MLHWLPALPEFYLLLMVLGVLSLLGLPWAPLLLAMPLLGLGALSVGAIAVAGAGRSDVAIEGDSPPRRAALRSITALLHLMQPLARLAGRLRGRLSPWRRRADPVLAFPRSRQVLRWSERWYSVDQWLTRVEAGLRETSHAVARGSDFDRWDLEVRGGAFGVMPVLCAVEEQGGGKQLARFRCRPRCSRAALGLVALFGLLSAAAALDGAWVVAAPLAAISLATLVMAIVNCAAAAGTMARAVHGSLTEPEPAEQPAVLRLAPKRSVRGEHTVRAASEGCGTAIAEKQHEASR